MRKICVAVIALLSWCIMSIAQDIRFVRNVIDSLASPGFYGRGYVLQGDRIAANYIAGKLKEFDVKSFDNQYFQKYYIDINTFPGQISLFFDKKELKPGEDFTVGSSSPSLKGKYPVQWLHANSLASDADYKEFMKKNLKNSVLILDTGFRETDIDKIYTAKAVIFATKGISSWDVSEGKTLAPFASLYVSREKIPQDFKKTGLNIENSYINDYQTQNVVGYIRGKTYPDSFFVFTAHYDHLGKMGNDVYFPGAHDNASGCAMLLDLARHYSEETNRPDYSIAFIFLSGEEAGLMGSKYYSEHPLFPLKSIKFLINLDMVSTGSDGVKVVNGSVLSNEFNMLVSINEKNQFLKIISPRGEAANSDHYWFYKKGVKCFYIYTLGNEWKEYHTIKDVSSGLPMTEYEDLFKLITLFVDQLGGN